MELNELSADAVATVIRTPAIIRVITVDNFFMTVAFTDYCVLSEVLSFNKRYEFNVLHKYTKN